MNLDNMMDLAVQQYQKEQKEKAMCLMMVEVLSLVVCKIVPPECRDKEFSNAINKLPDKLISTDFDGLPEMLGTTKGMLIDICDKLD